MAGAERYTVAELMVTTLAREIEDGDLLGQGLGTHLPTTAYFLAKHTHAPRCCFLYSAGGSFSNRAGALGLLGLERLALTSPLRKAGYAEMVLDTLPSVPFKEFGRPAQVDRFGNTNNMVIGAYDRPKVRLPGAGGIPDFSPYPSHGSYLYVPRHDRNAFVERIDFRSGVGRMNGEGDEERTRLGVTGRGARRAITDLAVIDFTDDGAVLASLHPGVALDHVRDATGFGLLVPEELGETPEPTDEQLRLIREEIDPLGLRDLEFVSSADRIGLIRSLLAREAEARGVRS